jgi:hypothetical protein
MEIDEVIQSLQKKKKKKKKKKKGQPSLLAVNECALAGRVFRGLRRENLNLRNWKRSYQYAI